MTAFVGNDAGHRHAVVRVTAHDGVNAADAAGHLQVHIHTVMAQQHHHLRTFAAGLIDHGLHVLVLNAELPVGHHVARVGNRRVRKSLADDGAGHTIDFTHHIGLEHRVAKVLGLDVLRHEVHLAGKVFVDDFLDALHAQRELPVAGHHIHAQQLAGVHHVLALRPQAGARALPGVTAVQQQGAGAAGFHALDQRGQMRKATDLAVAFGGFFVVQKSQCVGLGRARPDLGHLQQMLAHQMRQLTLHVADAHVDAGLTKVNRLELRVAVGHVQKGHVAEFRYVIQPIGRGGRTGLRKPAHAHAGHGARTHQLDQFAFGEIHICSH